MYNTQISRTFFLVGIIISFFIGVFLSSTILKEIYPDPIPGGAYITYYTAEGFDFQYSKDTITLTKDTATFWVRRDNIIWFETELGGMAKTAFTRITVNCKTMETNIIEQRNFDDKLNYINTISGLDNKNSKDPKGIVNQVAGFIACGPLKAKVSDDEEVDDRPYAQPLAIPPENDNKPKRFFT
jgi:hypothetical protein